VVTPSSRQVRTLWFGIPATRARFSPTWPFRSHWAPSGLWCLRPWVRSSSWREQHARIGRSGTVLSAIVSIRPGFVGVCCQEFGSWMPGLTEPLQWTADHSASLRVPAHHPAMGYEGYSLARRRPLFGSVRPLEKTLMTKSIIRFAKRFAMIVLVVGVAEVGCVKLFPSVFQIGRGSLQRDLRQPVPELQLGLPGVSVAK